MPVRLLASGQFILAIGNDLFVDFAEHQTFANSSEKYRRNEISFRTLSTFDQCDVSILANAEYSTRGIDSFLSWFSTFFFDMEQRKCAAHLVRRAQRSRLNNLFVFSFAK